MLEGEGKGGMWIRNKKYGRYEERDVKQDRGGGEGKEGERQR